MTFAVSRNSSHAKSFRRAKRENLSGACSYTIMKCGSISKDANKLRNSKMVNLREDIHPLTDFKRKTGDFLKKMRKTKRPVVLTVNGKAELVVQDAVS